MRAIPIQYAKTGTILGENLYTAKGQILLKAGTVLNDKMIGQIQSQKIFTIYIDDPHSSVKVNRLLEQSFRIKGALLIKSIFDAAANKKSIMALNDELSKYADTVLYEIKSYSNQKIEYIDIKSLDSYLYSSALNVALISALMGWSLNFNDEMVKHIFIGAIYHDIGIALLPSNVINKADALSQEEKMMIINHPIKGHQFIKDKIFLSAYVKTIVMTHHECIDGSGYPSRIKGDNIHMVSQIVGLADIYDAMTSDKPYKKALSPKEATEYIMGTSGSKYDPILVNAFLKIVSPYPRGTLVKLSDSRSAVIEDLNDDFPLRPKIKIIDCYNNKYVYTYLDLKNKQNITIEKTVYDLI